MAAHPSPLPPDMPITPQRVRFFDVEFEYPRAESIDWFRDYSSSARAPHRFYGDINYRDTAQVGDIKYIWELNRHQFLTRWGLDYRRTTDEGRAAGVTALILEWIHANPRYIGVNWASSLELALRILSWGIALDLCEGSAAARQARPLIVQSVVEQADMIRNTLSLYSSANNHLVGELVGLLAAGVFFRESGRLRSHAVFAKEALLREAGRQNFPDGVNREQALYYHYYTCEYLLTTLALFGRMEWKPPDYLLQLLRRMIEFVHAMVDGRGEGFEFGDTDDGAVTGLNLGTDVGVYESLLWSGWRIFGEEEFGVHAATIAQSRGTTMAVDDKTLYWHGAPHEELPAAEYAIPPQGRWVFPKGGYAILRSADVHAVFKAGPFAYPSIGAHPHCDELSVQMKLHGRDILTDSGTYCYHGEDAWRRYFRGTTAHNTVRVDGADQAEYAGPFLWLSHADGHLLAEPGVSPSGLKVAGEHNGYSRLPQPVSHKRLVEVGSDLSVAVVLAVHDSLVSAGEHVYELIWNFGPGIRLTPAEGHGQQRHRDGQVWVRAAWSVTVPGLHLPLGVVVGSQIPFSVRVYVGDETVPAGFYSRRFGERRPITQLRVSARSRDWKAFTLVGNPADLGFRWQQS